MKKLSFDSPQKALVLSLLLLFFVAGAIIMTFWAGQKALASYWQKKASGDEVKIDQRIAYMSKSVGLEKQNAARWRSLSQLFLAKVNQTAKKANKEKDNKKVLQSLGQVSKNAISAAKQAKNIDSKDPQNWANLGDVYLELIPYAQGSADQAVTAYKQAIEYESNNPSYHLRKARAKYSQAQRISNQIAQLQKQAQKSLQKKAQIQKRIKTLNKDVEKLLETARGSAEDAVKLKANYASAHLFLTNLYDVQGKIDEAINQISNVVLMRPRNAGLRFQLGLLHYKKDKMKKAQSAFEQAVSIDSDYANARYFLGLAYSRDSQNKKAIEQFEKVKELNPKNKEVKKIIQNLKQGKKPLAGIASRPTERKKAPVSEEKPPAKGEKEAKSDSESDKQAESEVQKPQEKNTQTPKEQTPEPQE